MMYVWFIFPSVNNFCTRTLAQIFKRSTFSECILGIADVSLTVIFFFICIVVFIIIWGKNVGPLLINSFRSHRRLPIKPIIIYLLI